MTTPQSIAVNDDRCACENGSNKQHKVAVPDSIIPDKPQLHQNLRDLFIPSISYNGGLKMRNDLGFPRKVVKEYLWTRPVTLPDKLYKFMSSEFVDCFVSGESVRIGTISDYRKTEKHKKGKGDPLEGSIAFKSDKPIDTDDPNTPEFRDFAARLGVTIKDNQMQGSQIDLLIRGRDAYAYCMAQSFHGGIAGALDDGYDVCVEIGNPERFLGALIAGFKAKFPDNYLGFDNKAVTYTPRVVPPSHNSISTSPFLKEKKFEDQDEYRFIISAKVVGEPVNLWIPSEHVYGWDTKICWTK